MFERPEEVIAARAIVRAPATAPDERAARALGESSAEESTSSSAGEWVQTDALDVCGRRFASGPLAALASVASQRVRALFVASNQLGPEGAASIAGFDRIQTLWAGDNQLGAPGVATIIDRCPALTTLAVARAAIGLTDVRPLLDALDRQRTIDALDLAQNELDPRQLLALTTAGRASRTRVLALDANRLDARAARELAKIIADWTELEALRLNACQLEDEGVERLSDALTSCRSLVALGLSSNGLTDRGAAAVASIVAAMPSLRTLELGFLRAERASGARPNAITHDGVAAILAAASAHRSLRAIDLRGNSISLESIPSLVALVEASRSIDALDEPSIQQSPHGPSLRAALARNANLGRPIEPPSLRRFLAPLRRLYAAWRKSVASRAINSGEPRAAPEELDEASLDAALAVLERVRRRDEAGASLSERERALRAASAKLGRREVRQRNTQIRDDLSRERAKAEDRAKLDATGIRRARSGAASPEWFAPAAQRKLNEPRRCYVCREEFVDVDAHYDRLCPRCAERERVARAQTADLSGSLAVVTGARVRIGFQVTLALLRQGCEVIATSRFANDAWARFANEPDFDAFRARLELRPIDLRFARDVERFAAAIAAERGAVDILVNNAAQTVARGPQHYAQLAAMDAATLLPAGVTRAPTLSASSDTLDLAPSLGASSDGAETSASLPNEQSNTNSWRASIDEVSVGELASAQSVNAIAPFVLLSRLRGALSEAAARRGGAYVVNVTAIEGQFSQRRKPSRHPHTNMAKAALNMLTLSVGAELARERVYVVSVDPGWISAQNPFAQDAAQRADGFAPPLDDRDAASRVLDPILRHKRGEPPVFGVLLKDYAVVDW